MYPFFLKFFGSIEQLKTAYFCLFVFTAVLNGFNVRSTSVNVLERIEDNKNFLKVFGIILLVQIGITYIGGTMFSCTPFAFKGWLLIFALAFTIIPVDMLRKKIITKSK